MAIAFRSIDEFVQEYPQSSSNAVITAGIPSIQPM